MSDSSGAGGGSGGSGGGSRRDFLRGMFGRVARDVASRMPDAMAESARELARAEGATPREPTPAELAASFVLPEDQLDIARVLVDRGLLLRAGDGRWAARRDVLGGAGLATTEAVATWMDRATTGRPAQRSRPGDAMLLAEVRRELGLV